MEICEAEKMFADYTDFNLFNPFDAFSQDNLLNLDKIEAEQPQVQQRKIEDYLDMEESTYSNIITDDELSSLNIKDLNRKLKEKGLAKDTIEKLKQRRRTLKNRKYATDCREKKDSEVQTLENAKDNEAEFIDSLEKENEELRDKLSKLKSHYVKLFDFAKKNNIELKPRNVPMGSLDST